MSQKARFPLRRKLGFFATLLVVAVAGSSSFYIRFGEKKAILENQTVERERTIKSLRLVVKRALMVNDETDMISYVNFLKESPVIAYAMVLNNDGKIGVHTDPYLIGKTLEDRPTQLAMQNQAQEIPLIQNLNLTGGRDILDLSLPVTVNDNRANGGVVRIGFDKKAIDATISETLQEVDRRILAAFLLALALGFVMAYILAFILTRPIQTLQKGAQLIGEGKLDHRISVHSHDEIHDLADDFNVMAGKLAELDRMKQDFVSNVTHELRSPMTSIRGYLDLLLREVAGPLSDLQRDYISIVKNSSVRLGRFIDNLLDVAKIEAHKLKLSPESQDIYDMAHEMEVLFKPQLDDKKIRFLNSTVKGAPPAFVDKDKLAEVLINLTSNAIKFTPENGTIRLSSKEMPNSLEICLEDSGLGIPSDMQDKIFNKFEQVKTTQGLARNQKGTGLGLTIVKGIIEAHGGKIWIKSPGPSGQGTAFYFTVPKMTDELKQKLGI